MSCGARGRSHRAVLSKTLGQPAPNFSPSLWTRWGGRFLRTPRPRFLPAGGRFQPRFLGSLSIVPSFAENGLMLPGKSYPARISHPSPPRRAIPDEKTGGGRETFVDYIGGKDYNKLIDEAFFPIRGLMFREECLSFGITWEEKWEMSRKKN